MTDNKNPKFPYIVLPNLSSAGDGDNITDDSSIGVNKGSKTTTTVKLPRVVSSPALDTSNAKIRSTSPPTLLTPSKKQPQSTGLSRHIALSKQFAGTVSESPQLSNEFQAIRKEVLMRAQYEMRKPPASFYPSAVPEDEIPNTIRQPEGTKSVIDLRTGDSSTKLDLEALSQLFPHRSRQLKSSRINLQANQSTLSVSQSSLEPKTPTRKSTTPIALAAAKSVMEKVTNLSSPNSSSNVQLDQLKSRLDGLTVHIKNRDCEVSKLKEQVVELQLQILKEKKDVDGSNELMERLSIDMESLSDKLESLENKLVNQETNILNKLLLIEEMGTSDSESEYGKVECKPNNWVSSSSTSNTTIPSKSASNISTHQTPVQPFSTGINSLKECVNWVPIAPDFDKLLNVIALLNFRMDRNQSMQLSRVGNEATFKANCDDVNYCV
ncbi:uncharacterized protein LOC110851631 isoform X1 [Folsomia candida]|uniref:uncharacterized protein LOC110851631 isoform X1 n=1 Tax=Folsomia candida TaxID=158441 RepID=UPI001604D1FB|nr:uncharacterized protein LOC110851631 isoform X1 [Folsomia candida]XP_035709764.1 uncharacterized protein LOC110851631 isoform X1 [Folsomia candida]XP_035709765.1 uncharacterized protein LOC110851631 isoform X1 [Folsomia candida]XP_035709766.1 uncharacterized protein LOC110851631 isoform X1 [Folsomia candida]